MQLSTDRNLARRTVGEWERHLGQQVRDLRLRRNITQERLAHLADVSVSTVHSLEAGAGSSLSTLIKVARALDREQWLEQFAPPVTVSPMQLVREQERQQRPRQRAYSPRGT